MRDKYTRYSVGIALVLLIFFLGGCTDRTLPEGGEIVPEYVFTYAENQAENYPTTQGANRFAQLVRERTNGRIEIQVNFGAVLGDEKSVVEQMQFGGVDFARVSLSTLTDSNPQLNVLQMPYLYNNAEHMWKVLEGEIGDKFLSSFEGTDLVALSWYDAGARNFYSSKKPIRRLEDMEGMRIRVQESKLMQRMVELLGATAVPTPYDEVYSSLQTGRIDGAENNWPSYESADHYEVAKYFTVDEHTRVPEVQLVSEFTWKKLSEEDQKIIRECAQESARYERKLWNERVEASEERVRAAGCEVILLTPDEKRRFQEKVTPLYSEYCGNYVDLIDEIVAAGREERR